MKYIFFVTWFSLTSTTVNVFHHSPQKHHVFALVSISSLGLVICFFAGGWPTHAFSWVERNGGIDSESDYPYTYQKHKGMCNAMKAGDKEVSIDGFATGALSDHVGDVCSTSYNECIHCCLFHRGELCHFIYQR